VTAWCEQLRDQYRPDRLEVCSSASPHPTLAPAAAGSSTSHLQIDNLYRGVAQALYGHHPEVDLADKPAVLARLQADGFWLIDAVDRPVKHTSPRTAAGRHHRRRAAAGDPLPFPLGNWRASFVVGLRRGSHDMSTVMPWLSRFRPPLRSRLKQPVTTCRRRRWRWRWRMWRWLRHRDRIHRRLR